MWGWKDGWKADRTARHCVGQGLGRGSIIPSFDYIASLDFDNRVVIWVRGSNPFIEDSKRDH